MAGRMRRRGIVLILAAVLAFVMLLPAGALAKVTDSRTPAASGKVSLKWERALGTGYSDAPTPPLVMGKYTYVYAKTTVYRLRNTDGSTAKKWTVNGTPKYATVALTAGDDQKSIFGFSSTGRVFRIDISGDKALYASKAYKGQNINPLIYKNGYIYGATWEATDNDGEVTDPGTFFCIDASTMKVRWEFRDKGNGGYYWDGAYVTDDGSYAVFGSQNGNVYSLDKSGKEVSRFIADSYIRCTVVSDSRGYLYFVSSEGYLYKLQISSDGKLSKAAEPVSLGAPSVNTPVIDGDRLYAAYGGMDKAGIKTFDISGSGLKLVSSASSPSVIKGEMLYSTASKCLYGGLYKGGGIYCVQAGVDGNLSGGKTLYTPVHAQYGISPIDCDENGDLYYKNDSGYVMAVTAGSRAVAPAKPVPPAAAKITVKAGKKQITVKWKKVKGAKAYQVYRSAKKNRGFKRVKQTKSLKWTNKKLKSKKTYYYKVRSYKAVGGKKLYSKWSNVSGKKVK